MAPKTTIPTNEIVSFIQHREAVSFDELMSEFHCSYMSIFRRKKDLGYITSYNRYGSGLTLGTIPTFNEFGIWGNRNFLFSKWGDVKRTIIGVVDDSPSGLYAGDLQAILRIRVNNHLSECVMKNLLYRSHNFGHPIYFSAHLETRKIQSEQREAQHQRKHSFTAYPLSKDNLIKTLLAIIKHHVTSAQKLKSILESEGLPLSERSIQWVLDEYNIEKKGSP